MIETKENIGPIQITISDPKTGEVLESKVIHDDYVLICAGNRYLRSLTVWGRTYQLNIAVSNTIEGKANVFETD